MKGTSIVVVSIFHFRKKLFSLFFIPLQFRISENFAFAHTDLEVFLYSTCLEAPSILQSSLKEMIIFKKVKCNLPGALVLAASMHLSWDIILCKTVNFSGSRYISMHKCYSSLSEYILKNCEERSYGFLCGTSI